ncbi:MAG: hypothetical protein ABI461_23740 [Polyangiaceae bacterium]
MQIRFSRRVNAVGAVQLAILGSTLLTFASGCGTLTAAANPKLAWAATESAPLNVVVRRADAAETTSTEVNRLLTATPASDDSDWMAKLALDKGETQKSVKAFREHPAYKNEKARIVSAEIWAKELSGVRSDAGKYANMLAAVNPDLGDAYGKVMAKEKELGELKAQEKTEEDAEDVKGVTDADKAAHKKNAAGFEAKADKAEDDIKPLKKSLIESAKTNAGKAPTDVKQRFGVVVVNLRQAVDDAKVANGAAALGYPMAVKGISSALEKQVPILVADILEEKTGKRPSLAGFHPGITFEGGTVGVTLNGLSKEDLGKINVADLTTETISRTQKWTVHALGLLASISETQETLEFESDVLEALQDGFETGGFKSPAASTIPEEGQ